jgi:hypothetical protein
MADLEAELRRAYARQATFAAAAFSKPRTALAVRAVADTARLTEERAHT